MTLHAFPHPIHVPGMPPDAPLATPTQKLGEAPVPVASARARPRVRVARAIAFGGAALMTAAGAYEMAMVVSAGGVTVLEGVMTALFVVTFGWIAFAAMTAIAGVVTPPARRARPATEARPLRTRTALVMPIYHEDPAETTRALAVMARGLVSAGQAHGFEIVILSDSTGADAWIAETVAVDRLKAAVGPAVPVWYRRRWSNHAKKAGNVRDFVERWGGRYDHFITLDADSLMAPQTLVALAAAMEEDPGLGLLQTVPVLAGGQTLFARLQQFAGRIYGPVAARGVAAWQGEDGNYWGHNAIIRMAAFASSCGLPELPGKPPFGGAILSHDFVEAALLRRAGWKVEMATDLDGSWENGPPSLIDASVRDRRWAQGNLQHLKVIRARGLRWPNRAHMAIGVMSYCISPVWLLLILFGFALAVQVSVVRPEYFPEGRQLFPTWPLFDSERMVRLFIVTMAVLFLPKTIGLLRALFDGRLRRACGGALRLLASALAELVVSALYAPIMMAVHSRHLFNILMGRSADWVPQRRGAGGLTWRDAWRYHRWHTMAGIGAGVATWFMSPAILPWLAPTLAGLVLAVPLSRASGSVAIGRVLARVGLLAIPEEREPDACIRACAEAAAGAAALPGDGIRALATDPSIREAHYRWANPAPRRRGAPDAASLTAAQKIAEAETLDEALAWLDPSERVQVAGQPALVEKLLALGNEPPQLDAAQ